jgi:hypothetical protein
MAPKFVIILSFLVSFLLLVWQYFYIDPKRRVWNLRFALMVCAIAAAIAYPIFDVTEPGRRQVSWLFLVVGVFWLGMAYYLLRRMPPKDQY